MIRAKSRTIAAITLVAIASFAIGTYANQVIVQNVQSLGGNSVQVPAPELRIVQTTWNIDLNTSTITGVTLNVNTSSPGATGSKLYQIYVQVSCLKGPPPGIPGTAYTCATGTATINLPVNGGSGILVVNLSPRIDPELIEVDDLSFIVTGSPPSVTGCTPDFTISARPSTVFLNITGSPTNTAFANITKTITANACFQGTVMLAAKTPAPGVTVIFVPSATVTLSPNQSVMVTEVVTATGTPPGVYPLTNIATSALITHTATVTLNVS
jgi:hypothetical protein